MDASLLLQLLANGVSVGLGYGLAAVGLALVFGILEQVNFAHGEVYMVGAFALWFLGQRAGLPYGVAYPLMVVLMAGLGLLLAEVVFLPTLNRPFESVILATFAVSIILQNLVRLVFGATPLHIDSPLEGLTLDLGGVLLFGQRMFIAVVAVLALALLTTFLRRTETGRAMRAMAQSKDACLMVGIDVRRITRITAAAGAALCALAAGAMAPMFDLYPNMGSDVVFKSFAVVIIGGMGNISGAMLAGLLLGVAESMAGGVLGAAYRDGIGFVLMILMLLLRPQGLFGKSVRV
ncbi:branched-chain amino acid ABC transporter permease [Variovorax ginsengisoli]|uniref:Branched-chain amino acid transport system permease protein n=1 Tax=Variovorax ginsengisoli TaxID=363844 RepID=A0ABT9S683_9BURK|nr:branched-chain amino acid ABC transporter permease [Variovorax ginsengisoli]MDP9899735.1 branched-chain amino acid transport system permease protein [Variovorax ginsengisoli]